MSDKHEFVVYTGPMTSGKSSKIIRVLDRCERQKRKAIAFKSKATRIDEIITHANLAWYAKSISSGQDIFQTLSTLEYIPSVIAVDEAFLIKDIAAPLIFLFTQGVTIYVGTLDLSPTCKPYPEVKKILSFATCIEKLVAVCTTCGNDARYTYKRRTDDESIPEFEPRCLKCHPCTRK